MGVRLTPEFVQRINVLPTEEEQPLLYLLDCGKAIVVNILLFRKLAIKQNSLTKYL